MERTGNLQSLENLQEYPGSPSLLAVASSAAALPMLIGDSCHRAICTNCSIAHRDLQDPVVRLNLRNRNTAVMSSLRLPDIAAKVFLAAEVPHLPMPLEK